MRRIGAVSRGFRGQAPAVKFVQMSFDAAGLAVDLAEVVCFEVFPLVDLVEDVLDASGGEGAFAGE